MVTTFKTVAREFTDAFETATRDNGPGYVRLREGSPEWMRDAVREAHGDRGPSDWVYEHCSYIVDALAEYADENDAQGAIFEIADSLVDVYTGALTAWLALHIDNVTACDDALDEQGNPELSLVERIQAGQLYVLQQMASALLAAIEAECDARDAAADDPEHECGDDCMRDRDAERALGIK